MGEAVNQVIRQFEKLVQNWKPKNLELQSKITYKFYKRDRERGDLGQLKRATNITWARTANYSVIVVGVKWFTRHLEKQIERNYERIIVMTTADYAAIKLLSGGA